MKRVNSLGWEVIPYKHFEISLESWGNGYFNAWLCDVAQNYYDWGMVASYMKRSDALRDAKIVADDIDLNPDAYDEEDTYLGEVISYDFS